MTDVVAMGELLIDFKPQGQTGEGSPVYAANPGGAPANVAVGVCRLGGSAAFLGKTGGDALSALLKQTLAENGVDVGGLVTDPARQTALAFVHLNDRGDRSFSFYRAGAADVCIEPEEIDLARIKGGSVFHFGSVSMTDEPARAATFFAAGQAKAAGRTVSFDPNYRPALWSDPKQAVACIERALPLCSVLKISEEEITLVTGENDPGTGMRRLAERFGTPLIFATLGPKGCLWRLRGEEGAHPAFDVKTIDTTGAGDCFTAAALWSILRAGGFGSLTRQIAAKAARFACAASSLSTAAAGAIPSLPTLAQVKTLTGEESE